MSVWTSELWQPEKQARSFRVTDFHHLQTENLGYETLTKFDPDPDFVDQVGEHNHSS